MGGNSLWSGVKAQAAALTVACVILGGCSASPARSAPGISEPDAGPADAACPSGLACGELCCSDEQECVQGACLPACASGVRCGVGLSLCCAAGEECKAGACSKICVPNCLKPDGSGLKKCGSDGCGGTCSPGCAPGEQCSRAFVCEVPIPGEGDSCASPRELQFDGDVARDHRTTSGMQHDAQFSCSSIAANDVVYSFTLTQPKKVSVSVAPDANSALAPIVALRAECNAESNFACKFVVQSGAPLTLLEPRLRAGTYFLWISSAYAYSDGAGPFELTVTLAEPDQPTVPNDTCANAMPVDLTTGRATLAGDLLYANDDYAPRTSCGRTSAPQMSGADMVYKIEADGTTGLAALLSGCGVYLRDGCDATANELACGIGSFAVPRLPKGTYYVFVDTYAVVGGPFTLELEASAPPSNDSCESGPQLITLDAAGKATVAGDTTFASFDSTGDQNCSQGSNDVVFRLHLDADKSVAFTVTPTSGTLAPIVYVRATCDGSSRTLACGYAAGPGPASTQVNRLSPGDWYVWVGGYGIDSWGRFNLEVTATDIPLPPNDSCLDAIALSLDPATQAVSVTGATTYALDDYPGSNCSGAPSYPELTGPDLVYKVTLAQGAALTATVRRDGTTSTFAPTVYFLTSCDSTQPADENACGRSYTSADGSVTAVIPAAEATTYYLVVDGFTGSSGPFRLDVATHPPVTNDACANPAIISIDPTNGTGTVTGDTSLSSDDTYGLCQLSRYSSSPDLAYQFTLPQERAVTTDVTPAASATTFAPALFMRTVCEDRVSELLNGCVESPTASAAAHLTFGALAAGTYFVWVDGSADTGFPSTGAFNLTVTTSTPPPAPAGDTCATAVPLTLTATADPTVERASAAGDTTNARDNARGVGLCEGSSAGDLVYAVTLTQSHKLSAKVTPTGATPSFKPAVYIRDLCNAAADSDQLAGNAASVAGGMAIATANSLPVGTYWIWVDSAANAGPFSLEVTASAPVAGPANDTCHAPEPLTFTGTTATAAGTTVGAQTDTLDPWWRFGAEGGDVVYSITTTNSDPRALTASVVAASGAPSGFLPGVIVRSRCGALAEELTAGAAYSAGQAATTMPVGVTAGTYFVWVDTAGTPPIPGPFTLTVTLEVPNDRCEKAENLQPYKSVSGDTTHAVDQYGTTGGFSTACLAALASTATVTPGPDVVYSYFGSRPFTVTVTPAAGFDPVVWVTSVTSLAQCGEPASCIAAANSAGPGGVEVVTVGPSSVPGYVYIIVDSAQGSMGGSFTIQAQ